MDLSTIQVRERQQNAGPCGRFTVREAGDRATVRSGGRMGRLSLCLGVLLIALVLELGGTDLGRQQAVFAAEGERRPQATGRGEDLGAIYYVEAAPEGTPTPAQGAEVQRVKWAPPVQSGEVMLLREDSVVGFSALSSDVSCCCEGQVFAVGEDEDWGSYVRVRSAGDIDVVYYGFEEVAVRAGQSVAAGQLLGTVPVGRQVYLSVSEKGAPQDPRAYVALTVQKQA